MLPELTERLQERLPEPARTHALALARRAGGLAWEGEWKDDAVVASGGLEYLARRITEPELDPREVASGRSIPLEKLLASLSPLREASSYRAYVGEWIREGSPVFAEPLPELVEADIVEGEFGDDFSPDEASLEPDAEDMAGEEPTAWPTPRSPIEDLRGQTGGLPKRWRAPFQPYRWQLEAADAWEAADGRGILRVVTGAGKTALAALIYARLLDRLESVGGALQLIVVVPRIALAEQWRIEFRKLLNASQLVVGEYHSASKCVPSAVDALFITQDSARRVLPRLRFDRPVLLVADECHRLGAPAAARILDRDYTWTLGLSATPDRGGDLATEETLIPRLGPVVYEYGYDRAVQDGIIARFSLIRIGVHLSGDESAKYDELSERVRSALDSLRSSYPELRNRANPRFFQLLGALHLRNRDDSRFEAFTAAASSRRDIVHSAHEKLALLDQLGADLGPPHKVLCFHERIEAAEDLVHRLRRLGRRAVAYHSKMDLEERNEALSDFRDGRADWLVSCRALDEGLNVPAVDTVIIGAGTKAPRQLIQRLGRALRLKDDNRHALVVLIEVVGADDQTISQEGLSELRSAADEVLKTSPAELHDRLSREKQADEVLSIRKAQPTAARPETRERSWTQTARKSPVGLPRAGMRELKPSKKPFPKSDGTLGNLGRMVGRVIRSWTGTIGNRSYYDKDSSPD